LLHTDISGYVLGAVPDALVDTNKSVRAKIGLKEDAYYLNAGVLLIDLERWRSEKIGPRALKFCISSPEHLTFWDQCALNHIIQGNFYVLNKKWNFQVGHMRSMGNYKFHSSARVEASSAAIIHFTSDLKPWNFMCTHPMKDLYYQYLKHTEWHDFREIGRTPRNIVKRYLRAHVPSTASRVEAAYMFGKRIFAHRAPKGS
jgi:lipopolysaccharide biosynthesis glycosyltransferase